MMSKKDIETQARSAEDKLYKLRTDYDSTKHERDQLSEKAAHLSEQVAENQKEIGQLKNALEVANSDHSDHVSETMEKLKGKDLLIEIMSNDMRQLKATVKNQEASAAYFKKKIDELTSQLEDAKAARTESFALPTLQTLQL